LKMGHSQSAVANITVSFEDAAESVGWAESRSIERGHKKNSVIGMKLREVSYGDSMIASGDPPNRVRNRIDIEIHTHQRGGQRDRGRRRPWERNILDKGDFEAYCDSHSLQPGEAWVGAVPDGLGA